MHFYCFLVKEITKWAEFSQVGTYILIDSCKVSKHLQTLYQCNGFNWLQKLFLHLVLFLLYFIHILRPMFFNLVYFFLIYFNVI